MAKRTDNTMAKRTDNAMAKRTDNNVCITKTTELFVCRNPNPIPSSFIPYRHVCDKS
jgi:hypothetical protein